MRSSACALGVLLAGGMFAADTAGADDELAAGFIDPPADARPLVFWQWVNGNVSEEGIRLDLEWMQRIGIAGAILFDVGFRTPPVPQYVTQRVGFGSPEWERAVGFAAAEARRLGLSLGAQSSGGWSVSGGPSVSSAQAMKKLVWSETTLTPRSPAVTRLRTLPSVSGPFQDIAIRTAEYRVPAHGADVAVIAFRVPTVEQSRHVFARMLDANGKPLAAASLLADDRFGESAQFEPDARGEVVLTVRTRFAPSALTLAAPDRAALPDGVVEASANGKKFVEVARFPDVVRQPMPATTLSLPDREQRHWRIRFSGLTAPLALSELRFDAGARIHHWQAKAGYGVVGARPPPQPVEKDRTVDPRQIVDLTSQVSRDGELDWRPTDGTWRVVRFGWSLTGRRTVPATPESIGLEVDKLDADAVRSFAESFFDRYAQATRARGPLDLAFTDSWEAGQQNWTPRMLEEFQARRGYDLRPWLPALTGRVVGTVADTERLLADFRRTLSELVAENHYGVIADVARARGMTYFAQAPGVDDPMPADSLLAKGRVDVPTGEFWVWPEDAQPSASHLADVRDAASAAHIHGKRIVAVESLTSNGESPWAQGPPQWRRMVDRFFVEGANKIILHTSAHQPFIDRRPGITLRQYGQHFTRNETWAEDAGAWIDYLARSSWLLQHGQHVADLLVFLGEDSPLTHPTVATDSPPRELMRPAGFDVDFINADRLSKLEVSDGRLSLPGGARYRAIEIAPTVRNVSLPVLRKLRALVDEGAVLIGLERLEAFGVTDPPAQVDEMVRALREADSRGRRYGHWDEARRAETWLPDVDVEGASVPHWTHRASEHADVYFLSNQAPRRFAGRVLFRIADRHAESWDAVTGARVPANYSAAGDRTAVQLEIEPWSSVFVVFRGAPRVSPPRAERERVPLLTLADAWNVRFLDAGSRIPDQRLAAGSWTRAAEPDIRYYSGRAVYSRHVHVPASRLAGRHRVELDLGDVGDIARVRINGQDQGTWWSRPFRRDVTAALRPGDNLIEIVVTNYWANRFIGDAQPGAEPVTFAPIRPYSADAPLRPSGLLGPVRLISLVPEKTP